MKFWKNVKNCCFLKNPSKGGKQEKTPFFVQNDLFWRHTAKTKHFLVECVLKRPPFIFKIRVCFISNFFTQMPSLYLKSDAKKSKNLLFSKIRHNLNFFQQNLLKRPPQNQKKYEDFVSQFFFWESLKCWKTSKNDIFDFFVPDLRYLHDFWSKNLVKRPPFIFKIRDSF